MRNIQGYARRQKSCLGIAGIIILAPGVIWFFSPRLTNDDVRVAFAELVKIPLNRIDRSRSLSINITVPDDAQWRRIRRVWGDPSYLLAAAGPPDRAFLYCTDELGIQLQVLNGTSPVSAENPSAPYGFSIECLGNIGTEFRSPPGAKLTLYVTAINRKPLPPGELLLINNWDYEKDKIVGVMLDEDFRKLFVVTSIIGAVVILFSAYLAFCPKHPPHQG